MRNRLTFANVIGVLLENKKKTYPQHQLVRSLFSAYLDDTLTASELIADDTTMYSRWCNGARPIPIDILKTFHRYWGLVFDVGRSESTGTKSASLG